MLAEHQAVLFYPYVMDPTGAHHRATACGPFPGQIARRPHSSGGEFRLRDPTGYALM